VTSWPSASRSSRVWSQKCCAPAYRHSVTSSGVGWSSARHSCGIVTSRSRVCPLVYPVRCRSAVCTTTSSVGPNLTRVSAIRWDPTSPRTRVSQRPNTTAARRRASPAGSRSQSWPSGPNASGLIRAGSPGPIANGSTPRARHSGSYSSLGSPRIRVRYPKSIIRNRNAFTVALLPRPGLPKANTFGLVTGISSASTQPNGSA
jgi:hypothetical protein